MADEKKSGAAGRKKVFKKRGEKKVVHSGVAHIQASFNNTLVTITDAEGRENLVGGRTTDPVDVGQSDFHALVEGDVDPCDASHAFSP